MPVRVYRVALFLVMSLSMSSAMRGAALNDASLQGSYFFSYQKIDATILFGPLFTTATGSLSFDGAGKVSAQGFINRSGTLQQLATTGTYRLDSTGTVQISFLELAIAVVGSVAYDLNALVASNVVGGGLLNQQILLATRQPTPPFALTLLNGTYSVAERTVTGSGSPQLENSFGTIRFDGVGNAQVEMSSNRGGSTFPVSGGGTYQVLSDGRILLTIPGRAGPVTVGLDPTGRLAVGATTSPASQSTHDLWVLTRSDDSGLGNAALDGSYQLVAGAYSGGFSTAAGMVDYRGDGKGFYQLALNNMGALKTGSGGVSFSVSAGTLQFLELEKFLLGNEFPKTLQMGLGASGYAVAAGSVSDPAASNFLIAIRTPIRPAAMNNAASFSTDIAVSPGGLFTLWGRNLARQTMEASFVSCPGTGEPKCLPRQMGGATLKVGGAEAPLLYVSPFQINAQFPFEIPPGPATVTVVLDGVEGGSLNATVTAASPGLFTVSRDGKGTGIFQHSSNYQLVTESNPARPGEVVIVYATGLGAVLPAVPSGAAPPLQPTSSASATVTAEIGGQDARVHFAGLAPEFVGLYQLNVEVPSGLATRGNVPLLLRVAGTPSNTATMPIGP
ncbi:MAG: hypothetical protein HY649_05010 [Acidobacteria bacterium]|nr:hypothetical protein [Acidobacteriota bacterium]